MTEHVWGPGEVLAGKFRLVERLGAGGMGAVWRAEHLLLKSPVAIKLIHERVAHGEGAVDRFLREARSAAALRSPHVIQVLDFGVEGTTPYLVMELLEGESLAQRLKRVGRLSPDETARIVTHVARALHRAHEGGVVHRDLKPDNVFLIKNLDEEIAKVLDFGIAKTLSASDATTPAGLLVAPGKLTETGAVLGSPHYMSPEQARGRSDLDHRSDLWAVGVIAFECLTGARPFHSPVLGDLLLKICTDPIPTPSALVTVPPGFDAWIARALARDPSQRFQSALEMAESLRALTVGSTSLPPAATIDATVRFTPAPAQPGFASLPPPALPNGKSPIVWIMLGGGAAVFALAVLGVGAAFALGAFESPSQPSAASTSSALSVEDLGLPGASSAAPAASRTPAGTRTAPPKSTGAPPATPTPAGATTTTTTSAPASGSDACQKACARIQACGEKCKFSGACVGAYKSIADCVNSKKSCFEMLSCG